MQKCKITNSNFVQLSRICVDMFLGKAHAQNSLQVNFFLSIFCRTSTKTSTVKECISGICIIFLIYTKMLLNVACLSCKVCMHLKCMSQCVCFYVCVRFRNLTRDYVSSAELMSKSNGSGGGLTVERAEGGMMSTSEV